MESSNGKYKSRCKASTVKILPKLEKRSMCLLIRLKDGVLKSLCLIFGVRSAPHRIIYFRFSIVKPSRSSSNLCMPTTVRWCECHRDLP